MVSFRGQKKLAPRPDRSPLGVLFKTSDEHPRPFYASPPRGPDSYRVLTRTNGHQHKHQFRHHKPDAINNNIIIPVTSISGDVTLEELEEKHFTVFERMCKDLNRRSPSGWWDFERLASYYAKISLTDRNALKNEFQNSGGNPSGDLMSHIKTKYPDHTVRHLVRNLESIERDDIALRLMPYTLRKPSSMQG